VKKLKSYVDEAIGNIRDDRATTKALLTDAMIYLKRNEENHKTTGVVVAKYLETLQRSNEQLVKVISLLKKEDKNIDLSEEDKDDIFDQIKEKKD